MTDTDWYAEGRATLGDRLAAGREAAGMTLAEAAARLGVRSRTLRDWEGDRAAPRANRLQMLAALYGVSLRWALTGEGDGPAPPPAAGADAAALRAGLAELRRLRDDLGKVQERLGRLERTLARAATAAAAGAGGGGTEAGDG